MVTHSAKQRAAINPYIQTILAADIKHLTHETHLYVPHLFHFCRYHISVAYLFVHVHKRNFISHFPQAFPLAINEGTDGFTQRKQLFLLVLIKHVPHFMQEEPYATEPTAGKRPSISAIEI